MDVFLFPYQKPWRWIRSIKPISCSESGGVGFSSCYKSCGHVSHILPIGSIKLFTPFSSSVRINNMRLYEPETISKPFNIGVISTDRRMDGWMSLTQRSYLLHVSTFFIWAWQHLSRETRLSLCWKWKLRTLSSWRLRDKMKRTSWLLMICDLLKVLQVPHVCGNPAGWVSVITLKVKAAAAQWPLWPPPHAVCCWPLLQDKGSIYQGVLVTFSGDETAALNVRRLIKAVYSGSGVGTGLVTWAQTWQRWSPANTDRNTDVVSFASFHLIKISEQKFSDQLKIRTKPKICYLNTIKK